MRNILTTFVGVLLALLFFVGIRYLIRQDRQEEQRAEEAHAAYRALQYRENSAREALKRTDACLSSLNNDENSLWPPVLERHDNWTWAALRKACGKPIRGSADVGYLEYKDTSGNLVRFSFGPDGVTVSYADPKHVTNPDLIDSIGSIACLSAVTLR